MDKKLIMKINDSWKDFRLTEAMKIFPAGAQHGFDLTDFKPGGFKKFLLEKQRYYYHYCK